MALFLMNHSPTRIMLLGRWQSAVFLDYIRPKVIEWTNNMSSDMIKLDSFHDLYSDVSLGPTNTIFNGDNLMLPRFHLHH